MPGGLNQWKASGRRGTGAGCCAVAVLGRMARQNMKGDATRRKLGSVPDSAIPVLIAGSADARFASRSLPRL
jgi:hypothetical protein